MDAYTLVTGASEGIGKEFARIAARKGRRVILTARSTDKLEALAEELTDDAEDVVVISADLSKPDGADALWSEASRNRAVDMVINNAGLGGNGPFADPEMWPRETLTIDVNITAATRLLKLAVPHMLDHGEKSRILNVASVAGFVPGPGMAVYHASKAYFLSLSEALSQELQGSKITVTALCPGATQTNFFNEAEMGDVNIAKGNLPSAASVAQAGWDGAITGQRVVVPGAMNKVLANLPRIAPRSVISAIAQRFLART